MTRRANLALLTAPLPADDERRPSGIEQKERPQPWDQDALLPVRVVLRDFAAAGLPARGKRANAEHLWRFIADELKAAALGDFAPHLKQELLEQGGLLLLDGLDEVPEAEERRAQIRQVVADFAASFPQLPHPGHQPHLRLPAAGLATAGLRRGGAGALFAGTDPALRRPLVCAHRRSAPSQPGRRPRPC